MLTVANSQLRGQSDLEKAQVLQWLGFADSEILPASYAWVFPCLGIMQYNKQVCNVNVKS
jgi:elongation factor 1-gamma